MQYNKGFTAMAALVVVGILALGGVGYMLVRPYVLQAPADEATGSGDMAENPDAATGHPTGNGEISIDWQFIETEEADGLYTTVNVLINGTPYEMGKFMGSCQEIGTGGGIDGTGLLTGELAGAQCWFAGGGNEAAVFAHEDGGVDLMVGHLSEGDAETPFFRGDFSIKHTIPLQ